MNLMDNVYEIESAFYGNGLIFELMLYLLLLYLLLKGGNIYHKIFIRYTILILIIIYNPLVIYLCDKILGGISTDVRLFYLLPIFPICAYGMTVLIFHKDKLDYKLLALFVILIVLSGKTFYGESVYSPAENVYKIPQEVVEVCRIIDEDDSYKRVIVPNELLNYIREYDARIEMCYGRSGVKEPISQRFTNGTITKAEFERYLWEKDFNYIVYDRNNDEMIQMFQQNDFFIIGETTEYAVLKRQNKMMGK